jgi:predicted metal-dependent peptidase
MYNPEYCKTLNPKQLRAVVMHENIHVMRKDIYRHTDLFKEDRQLANAACDYTGNDIIKQISEADPQLVEIASGWLWDIKFRDWTSREVYHFLKTGQNNQGKSEGKPKRDKDPDGNEQVTIGSNTYKIGGGQDEHDIGQAIEATPEQVREITEKINNAIHQGGLLAGRMGIEVPRTITEAADPEVDWREVLREFLTTHARGNDEFTWRKYNKRRMADDYYMPTTESEKVGEIIVAIDTSGSIGQKELAEFAAELASICEVAEPDRVRIIWWDHVVHGEQVFTNEQYSNIRNLLKPLGGGGTHVGCVSQHIVQHRLESDCVCIFTDGYVESDILWQIPQPTLWMVTQNASFSPPVGRVVKYRRMG